MGYSRFDYENNMLVQFSLVMLTKFINLITQFRSIDFCCISILSIFLINFEIIFSTEIVKSIVITKSLTTHLLSISDISLGPALISISLSSSLTVLYSLSFRILMFLLTGSRLMSITKYDKIQ